MQIISVQFAIFIAVALLLYHGHRNSTWRKMVMLGLNVVFLSTFAASAQGLLPLLSFLGLSFAAIQVVNRWKFRWLFVACLLTVIGYFLYLKRYWFIEFLPPLGSSYATIGLAYIIFRVLHVLIDTYQSPARRDDLEPLALFNYTASFLTLIAGPVQRYEDFRAQEKALSNAGPLSADEARDGFGRLTDGLFRLALLGPWMLLAHQYCLGRIGERRVAVLGAAASYLVYVYFNFSGYMGVVIGIGKLLQRKLPENFNSPFLATNFLDLWNRWHITVSDWFKTYVFNPLLHALCSRWKRPALVPYFGALGYFVVFFILGVWHDWGKSFVVLGFLLGLGTSVNKLWQVGFKRFLGTERHAAITHQLWYVMTARALALTWFTMSSITTWDHTGLSGQIAMLRNAGLRAVAVSFIDGILIIMAIELVVRGGLKFLAWARVPRPRLAADFGLQLAISARAFAVVLILLPGHPQRPALNQAEMVQASGAANVAPPPNPLHATRVFYGRNR